MNTQTRQESQSFTGERFHLDPPPGLLQLCTLSDFDDEPAPRWLAPNIIRERSSIVLTANDERLARQAAVAIGLSIAEGEVGGQRIPPRQVMIAGAGDLRWPLREAVRSRPECPRWVWIDELIDLADERSVDVTIATLKAYEARLLVVDFPIVGDAKRWMRGVNRIVLKTKASVLSVASARGDLCRCDTWLKAQAGRDGAAVVKVERHRDAPSKGELRLQVGA